jgi:two-component system, OmpR family, KDP operon response regulator KdpE
METVCCELVAGTPPAARQGGTRIGHNAAMSETARILVVDDDPQTTRALRTALMTQGYEVRASADAESALDAFNEWKPHLVLTDLGVSRVDGLDLCGRIRAVSRVAIVVVSAKTGEEAKVEALDAGADDYLTKPYGIRELLARVRAVLRRSCDDTEGVPIEIGDFRIDLASRRVYVRGMEVRLTPKEFDLFLYLARRPNRVIGHRQLLGAVWGEASQEHPEYLRVFVGQLRKKLEAEPSMPRYLATEPWVGYRFNAAG